MRRIPDGDYQAITVSSGERFYVSLRDNCDFVDDSNVLRRAAKSNDQGGLCSVSYSVLRDQALVELDRMREAVERAEPRVIEAEEVEAGDSGVESMDDDSSASLWVEKFRPRSFMQLLSDDGTNRMLLKWLKLWDKVVFGKEKKVRIRKKEEEEPNEKWRKFPKKTQLPDVVEELDETDRPLQRAALLHGPPGK
jgi:chromosome transmission fidelity protein 18